MRGSNVPSNILNKEKDIGFGDETTDDSSIFNTPEREVDQTDYHLETTGNKQKSYKSKEKMKKQVKPKKKNINVETQIRDLKKSTRLLIPRRSFGMLVKEIILAQSQEVSRITSEALTALQESTEVYVSQRLQDSYMLSLHRGCVTLSVKDMHLLQLIKNNIY